MVGLIEKCLKAGKCCVICGLVMGFSTLWHGKAEAAEGKGTKFCVIVPPNRYKPALEPIRHIPDGEAIEEFSARDRAINFFKGQVKKVGIGTPDCFRIETEEAALKAGQAPVGGGYDLSELSGEPASLFPGAGYFNRISRDGRRGVAFGAGIGRTPAAPHEEFGTPDAKVGVVFGFSF